MALTPAMSAAAMVGMEAIYLSHAAAQVQSLSGTDDYRRECSDHVVTAEPCERIIRGDVEDVDFARSRPSEPSPGRLVPISMEPHKLVIDRHYSCLRISLT